MINCKSQVESNFCSILENSLTHATFSRDKACDHHLEEVAIKEEEKGLGCGERPDGSTGLGARKRTRLLTASCTLREAAGSQKLFVRHQQTSLPQQSSIGMLVRTRKFRLGVHIVNCPGLLSSWTVTGPLKISPRLAMLISAQMRGQEYPVEKPLPWTNMEVLEFPLCFSSASLSPMPFRICRALGR